MIIESKRKDPPCQEIEDCFDEFIHPNSITKPEINQERTLIPKSKQKYYMEEWSDDDLKTDIIADLKKEVN